MERHADLGTIRTRVSEIVAASKVARYVTNVALVPATDGDGDDYIRVEVALKSHDAVTDQELIHLIRAIEAAVDELDERFASVRFPDAA